MNNCKNIFYECTHLVEKFDNFFQSKDESGYFCDHKIKDLGSLKLCLSQLYNKQMNDFFFVFYIVEVNDARKNIDFNSHYWKNDPSIKRMVKVSGNLQSIGIMSYLGKENDELDLPFISQIEIKDDNEFGMFHTRNRTNPISANKIIEDIKMLKIGNFFQNVENDIIVKKKIIKTRI